METNAPNATTCEADVVSPQSDSIVHTLVVQVCGDLHPELSQNC